jgi:hypothetical protein
MKLVSLNFLKAEQEIKIENSYAVSKTLTNSYNTNQEIDHQGIIDYPGNAETTKLISLSFEFSIAELEETNLMMNPDGRLKPHQ